MKLGAGTSFGSKVKDGSDANQREKNTFIWAVQLEMWGRTEVTEIKIRRAARGEK